MILTMGFRVAVGHNKSLVLEVTASELGVQLAGDLAHRLCLGLQLCTSLVRVHIVAMGLAVVLVLRMVDVGELLLRVADVDLVGVGLLRLLGVRMGLCMSMGLGLIVGLPLGLGDVLVLV